MEDDQGNLLITKPQLCSRISYQTLNLGLDAALALIHNVLLVTLKIQLSYGIRLSLHLDPKLARCDLNHAQASALSHSDGVTIANLGLRHHVKQGRRSLSRRWEHAILKTIASSRYQFFCIPTTTQTMNAFEIALTQLDPILLAEGSRGRCIVILQKVLRLAGSYDGFVDGIFGPKTRTAIEVLQAYFELPVTGVFDSNLWYALSCDRTAPEAISADLKRASWYYQPSQICPSQVSSLLGRSESVAA